MNKIQTNCLTDFFSELYIRNYYSVATKKGWLSYPAYT